MKIYYNPKLKEISRKLRKAKNLSEVLLWRHIKGRKIKGYQFSRQKPIGNYIVDFYCSKLSLVIEIDGITHDYKMEEDKKRQEILEGMGLKFIRFPDSDVRNNIEGVVKYLEVMIEKMTMKG